jgi:uncharacterized protein YegL
VLPELRAIEDNERVKIYMSAIKFGDKGEWHIGPKPVPLEDFEWADMEANGGTTATAQAIDLLADALHIEKIGMRNVAPVCILLSDGYCTDSEGALQTAIERLDKSPWGKKAVRLSIGIAENEGDYNKDELDMFISPYLRQEGKVETLHADTPRKLVHFIKTASTVATRSASKSNVKAEEGDNSPSPVSIDMEDLQDDETPDFENMDASEAY